MADSPKGQTEDQAGGKKPFILVAALLVIEAALIISVMKFAGGTPDVAAASSPDLDPELMASEKIVEVLVLDAKLPNSKSGSSYLYSTEIYVQVKAKHVDQVQSLVSQFYNEIKAELTAVWRTSEPSHFQEPKLETLTRKVTALLEGRLGVDPMTEEPVLQKCVIVMGTGFRVER